MIFGNFNVLAGLAHLTGALLDENMHQALNVILRVVLQLGVGNRLNASAFVSIISRLVVRPTSLLLVLTIHLLSACHELAPTSATDWFNKGCGMCYHV